MSCDTKENDMLLASVLFDGLVHGLLWFPLPQPAHTNLGRFSPQKTKSARKKDTQSHGTRAGRAWHWHVRLDIANTVTRSWVPDPGSIFLPRFRCAPSQSVRPMQCNRTRSVVLQKKRKWTYERSLSVSCSRDKKQTVSWREKKDIGTN